MNNPKKNPPHVEKHIGHPKIPEMKLNTPDIETGNITIDYKPSGNSPF